MNYCIRPAVSQDHAAILALIRTVKINPLGIDWERFLIAVDQENRLIGCGQVKLHRDGSSELASIAVTPSWRGQGIARALIERLVATHDRPLYLTCRSHLGHFYERFGFRVIPLAEMPAYFRRVYRLFLLLTRFSRGRVGLLVMRR
jgi:N-acetylglutamate synthase-like GNAT family acetyltransferase